MKSTSWKKEWVLIYLSDYDNTWSTYTKPLTIKQAINFINIPRHLTLKQQGRLSLVNLNQLANMGITN